MDLKHRNGPQMIQLIVIENGNYIDLKMIFALDEYHALFQARNKL